jgi:hypothetical protein
MPAVTQAVTVQQEIQVALDADGKQLKVGDKVVLNLEVTGIHPVLDNETGKEVGQNVELGHRLSFRIRPKRSAPRARLRP